MNTTAILYHGPSCHDGFCSALAAHKIFGQSADYIPVNYGDPVPELGQYKSIYILDFSYPASTLLELAKDKIVTVLDHHRTAAKDLEGLELPNNGQIIFDMTRSGAMLAWKYFHPTRPEPEIVKYVMDRDLWTWKLPHSREVSAALDLTVRTFQAWMDFDFELSTNFDHIVAMGSTVLKFVSQKAESLAAKAESVNLNGDDVHAVNSSLFQSEIGEAINVLYPDEKFSVVWFCKEGKYIYSLRTKRTDVDVSAVAKQFGGGGHPGAAGFSIDTPNFVHSIGG